MAQEAVTTAIHLSDIATTKAKMNVLREQIHALEEEHGITALREQLGALDDIYQRQIIMAVENKLFEEDHYHLVNKGRVMTVITPQLLFEKFPDIFWRAVKVGKGKTETLLLWLYENQGQGKPAAKKSVEATIDEISTKTQSGENYDLVDLLEGT